MAYSSDLRRRVLAFVGQGDNKNRGELTFVTQWSFFALSIRAVFTIHKGASLLWPWLLNHFLICDNFTLLQTQSA